MYLKCIEVHGFKSFAHKIRFDFHNGITGIVGPNGSGKSNVADAVRWVLGEQSAKQLRGASMQDVIFSGTENRKPLSYAFVAITLDNGDRQLNLDFNEVTVARRVYRSGESEYLLNGTVCRLKDVHELFYDTGIGKEGYSIIGQGQIDKILSGKPEERRELFDEAAGIVKYKRRKATAQKKLENEQQNLVRVQDILAELEKQIGPLKRQAMEAKIYLTKRDQLKSLDVNLFLLETKQMQEQLLHLTEKITIAADELSDTQAAYNNMKDKDEKTEQQIGQVDLSINQIREELGNSSLTREKLEGEINVLKEQIHGAMQNEEHHLNRRTIVEQEQAKRDKQLHGYARQEEDMQAKNDASKEKREAILAQYKQLKEEIASCQEGIEQGKNEIIELLNQKASTKADKQRYETMREQANIRRAQLNQRLLARKSEEDFIQLEIDQASAHLETITTEVGSLQKEEQQLEGQQRQWQEKQVQATGKLEQDTKSYHKEQSRLESMANIAERYDGYGNAIRRVMEWKEKEKGLLGVVADLIQVEKTYEIAIETALGGSLQNIVTNDDAVAKKMIQYLKKYRYGRATFLPLTNIGKQKQTCNDRILAEQGVIGIGSSLVSCHEKYNGLCQYLLGKTYVVDQIDNAVLLARKYQHSLRIVTLEGESLNPGGSLTGGAFKNSSNLLGRKREIEAMKDLTKKLKASISEHNNELFAIHAAREQLQKQKQQLREKLQQAMLHQNTAKINLDRIKEQQLENGESYSGLSQENKEIDIQIKEIDKNQELIQNKMILAEQKEQAIETENSDFQIRLDQSKVLLKDVEAEVSRVQLEEAAISQKAVFVKENMTRIGEELQSLKEEAQQIAKAAQQSREEVEGKQQLIAARTKAIAECQDSYRQLAKQLQAAQVKKEELAVCYKELFKQREDLSGHMNELDKELFRLHNQKEKLTEAMEKQTNYMWAEYELTYHNAMAFQSQNGEHPDTTDVGDNLPKIKKEIAAVREAIRKLGDINVNAIEDFKNLSERFHFLKTQHDDLITAKQALLGIIDELDQGMRKQFQEKFSEIQFEFQKAFQELFGGGKGTLALVETEDILECGIHIIAQPPGKKLQNMMQLSGGEKSLTAIALLFAIQNLKPSPFCLLDEIEAALDDSNVDRFAKYLHRLTKNTQFIVITHRRGTMAAADRLYGITMQEKGVSTLVSVNLIQDDLEE
jgi:chromosome segregation protein